MRVCLGCVVAASFRRRESRGHRAGQRARVSRYESHPPRGAHGFPKLEGEGRLEGLAYGETMESQRSNAQAAADTLQQQITRPDERTSDAAFFVSTRF